MQLNKIKKYAVSMMTLALLTGCYEAEPISTESPISKEIDELRIVFGPTDSGFLTTAEPLKQLLLNELSTNSYLIDTVSISIADSREDLATDLTTGKIDVAWMDGDTYLTDTNAYTALLALNTNVLSVDSSEPSDWVDVTTTEEMTDQTRTLIYATTSETGSTLATSESIAWSDLVDVSWATIGTNILDEWIASEYAGHSSEDLSNLTIYSTYDELLANVGNHDVIVCDAYHAIGNEAFSGATIIGVSEPHYIAVIATTNANVKINNSEFHSAFTSAITNLLANEEALAILSAYDTASYTAIN